MLTNQEIPAEFTGLIYAPSTEHEVYMLAMPLLPYLPWRLVFEEFEINPKQHFIVMFSAIFHLLTNTAAVNKFSLLGL